MNLLVTEIVTEIDDWNWWLNWWMLLLLLLLLTLAEPAFWKSSQCLVPIRYRVSDFQRSWWWRRSNYRLNSFHLSPIYPMCRFTLRTGVPSISTVLESKRFAAQNTVWTYHFPPRILSPVLNPALVVNFPQALKVFLAIPQCPDRHEGHIHRTNLMPLGQDVELSFSKTSS